MNYGKYILNIRQDETSSVGILEVYNFFLVKISFISI